MSNPHTPAPWHIDGEWGPTEQFPNWVAIRIGGSSVSGHVGVTNACLIAAAPDLLALAKQYASECAGCGGEGTWSRVTNIAGPETRESCADCAEIRKVIDKAQGKQP